MQIIKYSSLIFLAWLFLPISLFAINHPPEFIPPLTRGVAVEDTLIFTLIASDPDSDALTWSAENLPPGAQFNVLTQTFSWAPRGSGTYYTKFSVNDGQGNIVRKIVTIRAVNKGEWFMVRTADIKDDISKLFFLNDSIGWLLGGQGEVLYSNDGGDTWTIRKNADSLGYYYDFFFTNEKKGWAITTSGAIVHTDDGGFTWNKQESGTNQSLHNIQFVDSTTGWINGMYLILSTSDAGNTWTVRRPDNYFSIDGFYFFNRLVGWAAGDEGKILHTEDGGITWNQQTSGPYELEKIQFIDSTQGWAVGKGGTILSTKNGGDTWISQNSGTTKTLTNVNFVNDKIGWAVGSSLLHTVDGGITWSMQLSNVGDFYFLNSNTGWLLGMGIFKTIDGGVTWANQTSILSSYLTGVNFTDEKNGWAVGLYGILLHSNDGGTDWAQMPFTDKRKLTSVQFVDTLTGWITYGPLYEPGGIYHTSDGGKTWLPQPTNFSNSFLRMYFINVDTGWVVGNDGMIAHTTDGGNSWTNQWQGSGTPIFYDIYFVNSQKGWVAASNGVLGSFDGGATWNSLTTQFSNLYSVSFADTLNGWVTGWGGIIGHTSDGGKTWMKQNSGTSQVLYVVRFVDPLTGWAVGEKGTIINTRDGGETWITQQSGTTAPLWDLYFTNPTTGWAVGNYGTILKLRRDDEHLIKQNIAYQTTISLQSSPVLLSFSDGGGMKIQFAEGNVAGKALSVIYTQNVTSVVPTSSHFDKPAYYVDVSTTADNYKTNLVFKYTDDLVQKQGIKETELAAAYWDAKDSLWKSVPVSIDTAANTVTLTTDHLSLWALVSNKENLITGIRNATDDNALPLTYALFQNYPNPFNPTTSIHFQTPNAGHISMKIYNILGQEVKTVINKPLSAGSYEITWDGTDNHGNKVASGIYLYRMETDKGFVQTKKMVLLK